MNRIWKIISFCSRTELQRLFVMIWLCLLARWLSNWLINRELNSRHWQHKWNGWNDELSPGLLLCGGPRIIQNHLEAKQQQLHKNAIFGLKSLDWSFNVTNLSKLINTNKRGKQPEIKKTVQSVTRKKWLHEMYFNGLFLWNWSFLVVICGTAAAMYSF